MGKAEGPTAKSTLGPAAAAPARGARIHAETGTRSHAGAKGWGRRFRDEDKLRAAVRERAAGEWRAAAGRDLTERDARTFANHEPPPHEVRAALVNAKLLAALRDVAAFAADYQRVPQDQTVVGPPGGERPWVRQEFTAQESYLTRQLLRVVEDGRLRDLDPRVHDEHGDVILVSERPRPRRPGWFAFLEPGPKGWLVKRRGRIVSLLGDTLRTEWMNAGEFRRALPGWPWSTEKGLARDQGWTMRQLRERVQADEIEKNGDGHVRLTEPINKVIERIIEVGDVGRDEHGRLRWQRACYWRRFGFRSSPSTRLMACGSLLLGSWPKLDTERLRKPGVTVAEVIELEENAIRAQQGALARLVARQQKKTPAIS